jgi:hypothetical protein
LKDVLLVQVKNLLEPLYCTLLQAPAGGPTDQPFTNKAGSTEAFLEKDRKKVFLTHDQYILAGSVVDPDPSLFIWILPSSSKKVGKPCFLLFLRLLYDFLSLKTDLNVLYIFKK